MSRKKIVGFRHTLGLLLLAGVACSGSASSAGQKEKPVSVGQAAGIGALLGLALGSDPIVSAVQGAALGAAGGLITNAVESSPFLVETLHGS